METVQICARKNKCVCTSWYQEVQECTTVSVLDMVLYNLAALICDGDCMGLRSRSLLCCCLTPPQSIVIIITIIINPSSSPYTHCRHHLHHHQHHHHKPYKVYDSAAELFSSFVFG